MDNYRSRILATKSFSTGVTSRTVLRNGLPFSTEMVAKYGSTDKIKSSFIPSDLVLNSRSSLLKSAETLGVHLDEDLSLDNLLNNVDLSRLSSPQSNLRAIFSHKNPLTGQLDIDLDDKHASLIPAVVLSGVVPAQYDASRNEYFNPNGVVSRAEFMAILNKARGGKGESVDSIDKLALSDDFFSSGYNDLVRGYSSPLYRLYTREELSSPVTRGELAYMVVLCSEDFRCERALFGGEFTVGLFADWDKPQKYLGKFTDGKSLKLTRRKVDTIIDGTPTTSVLEVDLRKYKGEKSMTEYLSSIRIGKSLLPVPVFMALVELDIMGVFEYTGRKLSPLKEVSRLEMSYLVTQLSRNKHS